MALAGGVVEVEATWVHGGTRLRQNQRRQFAPRPSHGVAQDEVIWASLQHE